MRYLRSGSQGQSAWFSGYQAQGRPATSYLAPVSSGCMKLSETMGLGDSGVGGGELWGWWWWQTLKAECFHTEEPLCSGQVSHCRFLPRRLFQSVYSGAAAGCCSLRKVREFAAVWQEVLQACYPAFPSSLRYRFDLANHICAVGLKPSCLLGVCEKRRKASATQAH